MDQKTMQELLLFTPIDDDEQNENNNGVFELLDEKNLLAESTIKHIYLQIKDKNDKST